jgi:MFS family permease
MASTVSPAAPVVSSRAQTGVILAVLSLAGLGYALLSTVVLPALPVLQRDLHASTTGASWVLTAFLLSASVSTAIFGRLGDMFGKERLLLAALVILADATLLAAVSSSLGMLIVARILQGTSGGIFPLAYGIVRDEFPAERIVGSIGLMSSILGVGTGAGVVVGGLIVEHLSWHWLFWAPLIPTVVAVFATWWFVPPSPVRVPGRVNWPAAALMVAGIGAIMIAVSETTTWGWGSAKTIGLLLGGGAICALWITVEVRSEQPLIDMTMMRIRTVWSANLAAFLLGAGMISGFLLVPQFTQLPRGVGFGSSVFVSGLYLLPVTLVMALLGTVAGAVARRFGANRALLAGSLLTTAGFAVLWAAHAHPWEVLLWSTLLGIGLGLGYSALPNLIVAAVPPHQTGAAGGMNTVLRLLGGAISGQVASTFVADHIGRGGIPTVTGFTDTFAMSTVLMVICTLAVLLVPDRD